MSIAALFNQTVTVTTYLGVKATTGPAYSAPVAVRCFVNDARRLVRNTEGAEVVSTTTVYAPLSALPSFTVGSRVTVNGRETTVLEAFRRDSAGPANVHHVQIALT